MVMLIVGIACVVALLSWRIRLSVRDARRRLSVMLDDG